MVEYFWPSSVQALAQLLPVTYGLRAVRLCFESGALLDIVKLTARECLTGCSWFALSVLTMDKLASAGRRDGSIDFTG
jgi:ABC-2 type transport system permease protein